jgi:hypothetical protein
VQFDEKYTERKTGKPTCPDRYADVQGDLFPVALSCMGLIFHPRVGGPVAAAIMANARSASPGFATALMLPHATATSLGVAPALCLALSMSVG